MNETVRRSMFDPFFTTKATGRGLGLAAVLGIVQGHRGAIDIESEVGRGTSITVYLPASDKPAERETTTSFTPPALRGSGCALIVEDEVIVRDLATSLLSSVGFEVVSVADGESAVTYLQEHASTLSLVLLDIVLPRIDGQEVLRRLRAIRSDLPVILSSGNDIVDNDAIREEDDFTLFLKKPVRSPHAARRTPHDPGPQQASARSVACSRRRTRYPRARLSSERAREPAPRPRQVAAQAGTHLRATGALRTRRRRTWGWSAHRATTWCSMPSDFRSVLPPRSVVDRRGHSHPHTISGPATAPTSTAIASNDRHSATATSCSSAAAGRSSWSNATTARRRSCSSGKGPRGDPTRATRPSCD